MTLSGLFLGKLHFKLTQYSVFLLKPWTLQLTAPVLAWYIIHDLKAKDAMKILQYVCDFCFSMEGSMGHPLPCQTQLTNILRPWKGAESGWRINSNTSWSQVFVSGFCEPCTKFIPKQYSFQSCGGRTGSIPWCLSETWPLWTEHKSFDWLMLLRPLTLISMNMQIWLRFLQEETHSIRKKL